MTDPRTTEDEFHTFRIVINDYVTQLVKKRHRFRSEKDFVSMVFYRTHRKFLKRYKEFTPFPEVFRNDNYDCLSATTLYSLIFNKLGISHEIVETNYHIYINVFFENGNILIESTDPLGGFVVNAKDIQKRLEDMESRNANTNKKSYTFKSRIHDTVAFDELIGLHYYNASIKAYNEQNLEHSTELFKKALFFRTNPRINEFGLILIQALLESEAVDQRVKSDYVDQLQTFLIVEYTTASN